MLDSTTLFKQWVDDALIQLGINTATSSPGYVLSILVVILASAAVSLAVVRMLLNPTATKWVMRTQNSWDDSLHAHKVFRRLGHLVPAIVISLMTYALLEPETSMYNALLKLSQLYMLVVGLSIIFAVLNTVEHLYSQSRLAKKAPITGFVQIAKLLFSIIALLLCISILIEKSPVLLLSGLTAIAAVLLLIFRDTILGFVAGIQIAANRMFNNGDWIQMPKFDVDGELLEIGLTNVKVRNWDNTISTLPTYALTNEPVKNWRGMSESGGRRIKRAINIDIHTVKLCDADMLQRFAKVRHISSYIESKKQELAKYHSDNQIDQQDLLNSRQMTNIGTFRAYLEAYLMKHPMVNTSLTTMVRQLPPNEFGIPLEIYCFSSEKRWVFYEKIQADIFDHIMAMLPIFGLRAYQRDTNQVSAQGVSHQ
jgi:miniconductance mechanosensitive channel